MLNSRIWCANRRKTSIQPLQLLAWQKEGLCDVEECYQLRLPTPRLLKLGRLLVDAAKGRITIYLSQNRVHGEKLQPSLNAFVEWLPEGGLESAARDIIKESCRI
jgi:hypothetical protein